MAKISLELAKARLEQAKNLLEVSSLLYAAGY